MIDFINDIISTFIYLAYVSGEKAGLILETPYNLGETLNGTSGLDVDTEKKVMEETLKQLRFEGSSEKSIRIAMKELGLQRYISSMMLLLLYTVIIAVKL